MGWNGARLALILIRPDRLLFYREEVTSIKWGAPHRGPPSSDGSPYGLI